MWHANTDTPPPLKKKASVSSTFTRTPSLTYLSSGLVVSLCRRDILLELVQAGCPHIAIDIFSYLDSTSLLSCSLVCRDWQRLLLEWIYTKPRFRKRVR